MSKKHPCKRCPHCQAPEAPQTDDGVVDLDMARTANQDRIMDLARLTVFPEPATAAGVVRAKPIPKTVERNHAMLVSIQDPEMADLVKAIIDELLKLPERFWKGKHIGASR